MTIHMHAGVYIFPADHNSSGIRWNARLASGEYLRADSLAGMRSFINEKLQQEFPWEYTDTFGGEANYSWVKRGTVKARDMKQAIRLAKRAAGLSGVPCARESWGEQIALRPRGTCTVLFVG